MSRSYKKTPIMGHTTCQSERHDKRAWHKRWRLHERHNIDSLNHDDFEQYSPVDFKEVSNVWLMGKDGKHYFSPNRQLHFANKYTDNPRHTSIERDALKKRLIHKWMGK